MTMNMTGELKLADEFTAKMYGVDDEMKENYVDFFFWL